MGREQVVHATLGDGGESIVELGQHLPAAAAGSADMEFGWYHEFHRQVEGQSDADAFEQGFETRDLREAKILLDKLTDN